MKIHTNLSFKYDPKIHGENPVGKSMTQPDMAFSVQELLQRFTHGSMPAVVKEGHYQEDADFDNYDRTRNGAYDLADAVEESNELMLLREQREKSFQEKLKLKKELLEAEQKEFAWWKNQKKAKEAEQEKETKKSTETKKD